MPEPDRPPMCSMLFTRCSANPLLDAGDWPYCINAVFNAAATRLPTGETLVLARVEDMRGMSHLCAARSADGVTGWKIDETPTMPADPENWPEEAWGVEDPRITWMPELGQYGIAYTCYSRGGPGVSLAFTKDFKSFQRTGMVMNPDNKDAALFPRRFGGRWALIHRPSPPTRASNMWIAFSPDFRHWGDSAILMEARSGGWWDAGKIGLSTPPLETEDGWLILYHGVRSTASGSIYRVGLALFDLEDPRKLILRGDEWLLGPGAPYERSGDVPGVVFPCGYTLSDNGDQLNVYYGAADTSICLATARVSTLLAWLKEYGQPG